VVVVDDVAAGGTAAREAVFLSEIPADAVFVLVDYSRWTF
jgi:orotate phosphoribosyltransferase